MERISHAPTLCWALALVAALPPAADDDSEEAFVAWAREAATPLDTLDWRAADVAPLAALDVALEGKRIVLLGEPDHFVREKMDVRLLVLRHLYARGFRAVGMEQGRADGKRIDRFLATGDEAWLARVAIYGYDGDLRDDRDDGVPGWTGGPGSDLRARSGDEARWFARELRWWNAERAEPGERLAYFGFDVSMKPGGGYADAREVLEPRASEPLAQELLRALARVPDESRLEEAARLDALGVTLAQQADEVRALVGDTGARELERSLACLADSLRFVDGLKSDPDPAARRALLEWREQVMHRRIDEVLAELGPDAKVVLLGHDLHLGRDSTRVEWQGATLWPSLGTHLARTRPGEVLAVWMLCERGEHLVPGAEPPLRTLRSRRDDLESLLGRVGERFLLPLSSEDPRAAFLDEPRELSMGGYRPRCALREQADAILFVRDVTAPGGR